MWNSQLSHKLKEEEERIQYKLRIYVVLQYTFINESEWLINKLYGKIGL